jgi:photosystem II stability/assembly factor-like uncharacterized protein
MKMGFNTSGNLSTSGRTAQAVNLGYLRNRLASTTRKFNYCKQHSENPSLCINEFVGQSSNVTPQSKDGELQTIVTGDGEVLSSTNYGNTWTVSTITGNPFLFFVKSSYDSKNKVALTLNNSGWHDIAYLFSNNVWTPTSNIFNSIDISSDGKYQTAANGLLSNSLFRSADYGNNWSQINNGITGVFSTSLSSSGQQQVCASATNEGKGNVYKSNDYGITWSETNIVKNEYMWICANISGDGLIITAGSYEGVIQYSQDNGSSWHTSTIESPGQRFGQICSSYNGQYQAAIKIFIFEIPTTIGYLYLSNDYGVSWHKAPILNGELYWYSISISNSGNVITALATDNIKGYYFRSLNAGVSFERLELPYFMLGIDIN